VLRRWNWFLSDDAARSFVVVTYKPPHMIAYWDDLTQSRITELYKQVKTDARY
jgi:hypothetical protein